MGLVGAIVPCTQTRAGATCVRASAMTGGVIGLAGGVLSGAADRGRIGDAAVSSSIGFLAGSAIGLVVKPIAQRVGWEDVFTLGLVGGAVGSQPRGAALGLAGGTVVGGLLWVVLREVEFPDALGFAVAGMALGVMGAWIKDGVNAQSGPSLVIPLQFRL